MLRSTCSEAFLFVVRLFPPPWPIILEHEHEHGPEREGFGYFLGGHGAARPHGIDHALPTGI